MSIKLSKTHSDLTNTLVGRGIPDFETKKILDTIGNINYFQIFNGIENLLLVNNNPKKFMNNISVDDFMRIYKFEKEISQELLKSLGEFEEKLRTSISYHFTNHYSQTLEHTMQYTNKRNYVDIGTGSYPFINFQYKKIYNGFANFTFFDRYYLDKIVNNNDMIDPSFYSDPNYIPPHSVAVYSRNQNVAVPLWVSIEICDFGTLKYLCHYLKDVDMEKILIDFGLTINDRFLFLSTIDILLELRNKCAHGNMIFNFSTPEYIKLNSTLINRYNLNPLHAGNNNGYPSKIYLFDTLVVLSQFVNINKTVNKFKKLIYLNNKNMKKNATVVNQRILTLTHIDNYSKLKSLKHSK